MPPVLHGPHIRFIPFLDSPREKKKRKVSNNSAAFGLHGSWEEEMRMPLIGIAEAARRLGIAPKTLYKWVENGQMPFIRIGRLVRFRTEDLEEWVEGRVCLPASRSCRRDGHGIET